MLRFVIAISVLCFSVLAMEGRSGSMVVADSVTHSPLPHASIFDRDGNVIGVCDSRGCIPYVSEDSYPIAIRYLGFKEGVVWSPDTDTIFLRESFSELPEIVVESRRHKIMHILAYLREYSTLTTYSDTVFLFREKMVDYMLPTDKNIRFKGWSKPRILKTKSYYRFTNGQGIDSVSDESNYHFSWSDWVGIAPSAKLPAKLLDNECASDTLRGKYSSAEIWTKKDGSVNVDVNVLADTASRKWVPNLSGFFRNRLDFENFRVRYRYCDVVADTISPTDLAGYSFNIESNGRGHDMFQFNRVDQRFFVSTYAEVYVVDKEYITVGEARKWHKRKFDEDKIEIYEPIEAPELQPSIQELVERVNGVDKEKVRLGVAPDHRLVNRNVVKRNFGHRVLQLMKTATGISRVRAKKSWNRQWNEFTKERNEQDRKRKSSAREE
ncbi:MAG: hypothetical protein NC421_03470 [Lachnospiraceae bacterium]|nr:hypothetical protein [Lachnospiraceae bacterium]